MNGKIFLLIILIGLLITNNCEQSTKTDIILNRNINYIRLENQSDHSGIIVLLKELNIFTITDSLGFFEFDSIPDGKYSLIIKYPYFRRKEMSVKVENGQISPIINLELKQLIQFWIEPSETTISLNNSDEYYFRLPLFKQYSVNISDQPVQLGTREFPLNVHALVPQNFDWPFIPNPDNRPDYCYDKYGWLGGVDIEGGGLITLYPNDTTLFMEPIELNKFEKQCFKPGTYLFFSIIADLIHFPEYFKADYFWADSLTNPKPLNPLNKTLLKKKELFRPAIIYLKN
ncbi:hypothetical protein Calab_1412 [Caldithrix abyssi DSM 13497]|uniref:Carboxypeptidase regulatory-like domain-containing protein n=1 Tax=Caldithrix abyssi DSM 13497 TaxID=880073 RepID=H1XP41_CALAY|nr:hypothetical protein [Caldithrix abyssi]APF20442.1 hypothetical protein Cabys_3696 [Caldithrix abyssi DSM 13497]EHO41033.1 hypothetical protein Calab_1412 [Caldithrix abyssi DSM 13497]